jgi:DNA ligase-1
MDFNQLVDYYERIAATSKRLEIIDILAELFRACKEKETLPYLRKIVYLTQGQLTPEYEELSKFGIAEKMIIQALVKSTGKDPNSIKEIVNKRGDVGEAIQVILESQSKQKQKYSLDSFTSSKSKSVVLSIPKLYDELGKLAAIKGEGSQDAKMNIINSLIRLCTPQSAKYVVNIILGTIRIGIADMSILDGMAVAYLGTKTDRSIIENAYNIHPDLGEIAEILAIKGIDAIKAIQVKVGVPIRMMAASRVPYTQIHAKMGGSTYLSEYKYDGERVQVHMSGEHIILFSRRMKPITDMYPDIIETVKSSVQASEAIFEGEIVAMDVFMEKMLPFQVVSTRRRKYDIGKMTKEVPVCLFCFDLLYQKKTPESPEEIVMNRSLPERRKLLQNLIKSSEKIRLATAKEMQNTEEMVGFFNQARAAGAEGIMNKTIGPESVYQAGNRGFLWIKMKGLEGAKMSDTIDVVIIGASWGKGRRAGFLSTIFGAVYNDEARKFEFFTRIGSGFSDEDYAKFTEIFKPMIIERLPRDVLCTKDQPDVWIRPEIVIEIMGDELTISNKSDTGVTPDHLDGYSLRFPVYQRVREDKSMYDCTTTNEIIELYQAQ